MGRVNTTTIHLRDRDARNFMKAVSESVNGAEASESKKHVPLVMAMNAERSALLARVEKAEAERDALIEALKSAHAIMCVLEGKKPGAVMTQEQLRALVQQAVQMALPDHEAQRPRKRLLTGKEVQKEYGIAERNLERWRYEGIGPQYTTIGRRIFYERDTLESFIAAGRVKTTGRAD